MTAVSELWHAVGHMTVTVATSAGDIVICGEHEVYPYPGMPLRERRKVIPGLQFYFGDMPSGSAQAAHRDKG